MNARLRAPAAAFLALLMAGDLAAFGPAALFDARRWAFPFLVLFVAFERLRRRWRLLDEEAFLLGAAAGLVYEGAYAKTLQDGLFFLGVNWLGSLSVAFDGGLVAVLALHILDARWPRPAEAAKPTAAEDRFELGVLGLVPAVALAAWLFDAYSGRTRVARMLGPAWLLADLLFVAAAAALVKRALARAEDDEPAPRDRGLWALVAFSAWLPPAQFAARLGGEWLSPLGTFYLVAWTVGFGAWARMLWRQRGRMPHEPRRVSRPLLLIAAWRLVGAAVLAGAMGPASVEPSTAGAYAFLVDLPTRLLFFSVFFASRFAV